MDLVNRCSGGVFLSGQAVSILGDGLAILALPLLVLELTENPTLAALAASPRAIAYLLFGLPIGPLVDRAELWIVLLCADAVRAVIFSALYVLSASEHAVAATILVLAAVAGGCAVFSETGLTVAIRDMFAGRDRVRANALLETATQLSIVVGPAVVGVLAMSWGLDSALLVNAVTFAVSSGTLLLVRHRVATRSGQRRCAVRVSVVGDFREGWMYLWGTPILVGLVALLAMSNLGIAVQTLIVFFAHNRLALPPAVVSAVAVCGGIGGVVGAVAAPYALARVRTIWLVAAAMMAIAGALAAVGLASNVWWLAVANAALACADVLAAIAIRTLRQQIVPRRLLGRVTSIARTIVLATMSLGTVLCGLLTQLNGNDPRPVFIGAAFVVVAATATIWVLVLHRHRHIRLQEVEVIRT